MSSKKRVLRKSSKTTNTNPSFRYRYAAQKTDSTLLKDSTASDAKLKNEKAINADSQEENVQAVASSNSRAQFATPSYNKIVKVAQPFDFKTKQRPFEYTFFSRDVFDSLLFGVPTNRVIPVYQVGTRKMLIINHLSVDLYYNQTDVGSPVRTWPTQYPADTLYEQLSFDLTTTTSKLYDSLAGEVVFVPYAALSPQQGSFVTFGKNVLENGSSSTSLYAFENTTLIFKLFWNPTLGFDAAPTTLTVGLSYKMTVRGHLSTMSDYFEMQNLKR